MKDAALRFTYGDYLALPQNGPRYQLVDGDLIVSPSPTSRHQRILARLFRILANHIAARRLGEIFCAPLDVQWSEHDATQPDLLFVAEGRRGRVGRRGVTGPPDLAVEILSEDREMYLDVKRKLYARHGLPEYWVVDPEAGVLFLYRLQEDPAAPFRTFGSADRLESPSFPGLTVDLRDVFAP